MADPLADPLADSWAGRTPSSRPVPSRRALAPPPRHALLYVGAEAWARVLAHRADLAQIPLVADWATKGWPLIARRRDARDASDAVPAGLPLPPALGKARVRIALVPDMVERVEPLPPLQVLLGVAPASWGRTIEALGALGDRTGCAPRVFGSFAWAALTGLAYLEPTSDLDLLWALRADTDVDALTAELAAIERAAPGAIDGELVREPGAMAVNWRELHGGADEILVKTIDAVALRPAVWFRRESRPS